MQFFLLIWIFSVLARVRTTPYAQVLLVWLEDEPPTLDQKSPPPPPDPPPPLIFKANLYSFPTKSRAQSGDKKGGNILESLFSFLQIHTHTKQYFSFFCKLKVKEGGISSLSPLWKWIFSCLPPLRSWKHVGKTCVCTVKRRRQEGEKGRGGKSGGIDGQFVFILKILLVLPFSLAKLELNQGIPGGR